METYLERYCKGEYEQVWNELIQCGANVRQDHIYPDALAVAQEIMRRVRHNLEELIERLVNIGFIFGYDRLLLSQIRLSHNPFERRIYLEMLDWAHKQTPVFLSAKQLEEEKRAYQDFLDHPFYFESGEQNLQESRTPLMKQYIDEIEQLIGPVPLSIQAWYEEVGAINFYGFHPRWDALLRSLNPVLANTRTFLMSSSDPLQVCTLDKHKMIGLRRQYEQRSLITFEFAEDCYDKDYCSGSSSPYFFNFPNPCADAVLFSNQPRSFVQYLRTCILQWAGFPGMAKWKEVPKEDLTFLTQDLLPF